VHEGNEAKLADLAEGGLLGMLLCFHGGRGCGLRKVVIAKVRVSRSQRRVCDAEDQGRPFVGFLIGRPRFVVPVPGSKDLWAESGGTPAQSIDVPLQVREKVPRWES
jgi:hypothetical protein